MGFFCVLNGRNICTLKGESMLGFAFGNFFAEPSPQIELRKMGRTLHLSKVLFEQWWLAPNGLKRDVLGWMLAIGSSTIVRVKLSNIRHTKLDLR